MPVTHVVGVACVAAAAAELHGGILVVHTVDGQPRVPAGGVVVAQDICRLAGKIERVSDIHFAACVWLQLAYGGVVVVAGRIATGSGKQDGKEERQRQPVP